MRAFLATALPENPLNLFFLLLFAAVFAGVALWNLRPSLKKAHDEAARMPLQD
jgi:cbb3-type cytochrome oxidase subunit 3